MRNIEKLINNLDAPRKKTNEENITTADFDMTPSQENAIEYAILRKFNDYKRCSDDPRIVEIEIAEQLFGTYSLVITMDNNKPGTLGYVYKTIHHLFIGRNGGYSCYHENKRIQGWRALIYC